MSLAKAFPLQYNPVIDFGDGLEELREESEEESESESESESEESSESGNESEEGESSEEEESSEHFGRGGSGGLRGVRTPESFEDKQTPLDITEASPSHSEHPLLPKPDAFKTKTTVIMLDSLDRNILVYPLPTQVAFPLPRLFKTVERIDIVQVKFFSGLYNISPTLRNNTLTLTDATATTYNLMVPSGFYGVQQLTATLQGLLNGCGSTTTFAVTWNPITGRVTIGGTDTFSISLFKTPLPATLVNARTEWGLGWILGWNGPPAGLTGSASYVAPGFPRVDKDYVFLQMNDSERMNQVETSDQVGHYFGKLLLNEFGAYAQSFVEAPKIYEDPLGRLERLQFVWTDRHGSPLVGPDAATCDWHMTLRITERISTHDGAADEPAP